MIGVAPIPIYNEGIRLQPITALGVARGFVDMFRVGKGIGAAIFCDDIDGWERAVFVAQDITRASALFATLAGPVARNAPVTEGIYEFETSTPGVYYVGQSKNIAARIAQHEASGLKPKGTPYKARSVSGGTTPREIAEYQRLREITGGVPAKKSPLVANKKDPIGPKRSYLLK